MRRLLTNLALVAGGALFGLLVLELALRVSGIGYPFFYTRDIDRGNALRPGTEGYLFKEGQKVHVSTNSHGMREREISLRKLPGTLRVAVLGDSFVEAVQVPAEKTFPRVMERELAACKGLGGKEAQVLNFGVSGYGTAQELLTFRHLARRFKPDLVVLAVMWGNDIRNNSKALETANRERPFFVYRNGELVLDNSFRDAAMFEPGRIRRFDLITGLINRVRVLELLREARYRYLLWRAQKADEDQDLPDFHVMLAPPPNEAWSEAWRITEDLLVMLDREVRETGAKLLVAVLGTGIAVDPNPKARAAFQEKYGLDTLFYPDLRIRDFARSRGIPAIALGPDQRSYAEKEGAYLSGFPETKLGSGHYNAFGHRTAGLLLAGEACRMLSAAPAGRTPADSPAPTVAAERPVPSVRAGPGP